MLRNYIDVIIIILYFLPSVYFKHLITKQASKTKQIGCELGQIKNEVKKVILALTHNESMQPKQYHEQQMIELNSTASSFTSNRSQLSDDISFTPPILGKISKESIKSSTKLNEKKISQMFGRKSYNDKFSIKIDDEKDNDSTSTTTTNDVDYNDVRERNRSVVMMFSNGGKRKTEKASDYDYDEDEIKSGKNQ